MDNRNRTENDARPTGVCHSFSTSLMTTGEVRRKLWSFLVVCAIAVGIYLAMNSMTSISPYIMPNGYQKKVYDDSLAYAHGPEYKGTEDEFYEDNTDGGEITVYGKPIHEKDKTVLYMSVPKTGSRTVMWTIGLLRRRHHFGPGVRIENHLRDFNVLEVEEYFSSKLLKANDGAILHGHYRYINMGRSPKKPVLMSMVRDPIDRFESHFYFVRHGDKSVGKEFFQKSFNGSGQASINETLDDCVQKERQECTGDFFRYFYVRSFCGYAPECSESPAFALEEAKRNVDNFLMIGLTEEYGLTLAVFEKLLKETFGGAPKIYEKGKSKPMKKFKTVFKKPPSEETRSILRDRMEYDYQFYEYVKKRLHRAAMVLGVGESSS